MSKKPPSTPADWVWIAFLVWTAIGFVVMLLGIGESQLNAWGLNAAVGFLHTADAIWILLAAISVYLHTAEAEGIGVARTWAAIILASSSLVEWIGVRTGIPFGEYAYTDHFGWRMGGVLPVAIPLAWLVILLCSRVLVLRFRPYAGRVELATGVALLAVLTDLNLEFVAWKVRAYWIWYPSLGDRAPAWPPVQNYVTWFALMWLLTFLLPPNHAMRPRPVSSTRPILILALMTALFLAVHLRAKW
jgi:uncharacterized membrane protein